MLPCNNFTGAITCFRQLLRTIKQGEACVLRKDSVLRRASGVVRQRQGAARTGMPKQVIEMRPERGRRSIVGLA